MKVLVVDDEPAVRHALRRVLALEGYDVELASDGGEALRWLAASTPDAVILDVLMPEVDGLEVCRRLRRIDQDTPVLMLTVRDGVRHTVEGLDAGADDYLTKPFEIDELLARLRALLRRRASGDATVLRFADLELDQSTREVRRGGRAIVLTPTEFSLLEFLLRHPRQVLTRTAILEAVWGFDFGSSSNILEVYVGYLRRKLEADGEARLIHTHRGIGYALREP
jgi:two-component system response regulator MprA